MMPEPITFRSLVIESFRGFKDPVSFELDASAVLITGPNGTGKTSFFDAILWLLTGNLERLKELRAHEKDEWVVNEWSRPGQAVVEADITVGGDSLTLRRSGDRRQTLLELRSNSMSIRGRQAQEHLDRLFIPHARMSFEAMLLSSGILQQDVMRWLIEAKAAERYRLLNQLLGLDVLQQIESASRDFAKRAAEEAQQVRREQEMLRQARSRLESEALSLEARQQLQPSVDEAISQLEAAIRRHQGLLAVAFNVREQIAESDRLFSDVRRMRRRIAELKDTYASIQADRSAELATSLLDTGQISGALDAARAEAASRTQELQAASNALATAEQRSNDLAQLAALAIPLLTDLCPVCQQPIDPAHVAHQLEERVGEATSLAGLRQARALAEARVTEAAELVRQAEQREQDLRRQQLTLEQLDSREAQWARELSELGSESERLQIRQPDSIRDDDSRYDEALADLERAAERLTLILRVSSERERLQAIRAEIAQVADQAELKQSQVEALARREANAETLWKAMQQACMSVGERRARALAPLVSDVFSRLDPHPAFKSLDLEHEMYRAQAATVPMATDPLEGRTVNPALVFSTSQANIAALSIFLALSFAAGEAALPFVLLDDPLQSLDDVNVLAFADLCRFIRDERQLILSTHDRRFASLLERKLTPRRQEQTTRVIRFKGWERSGPSVESQTLEGQLNAPRLIPA